MSKAPVDQVVRLLQGVPFFAGVQRENLAAVAAARRPQSYRRHQVIFQRGDPGDALHIVSSGLVRIVLSSPDGSEILLAAMQPGDFFGELSLLDGLPRSATAVASEPTVTLTLARPGFLRILERTPQIAHQIILALSARLRRTDVLLGDSAFLDVATRIAKRLRDLAHTQAGRESPKTPRSVRVIQAELAAMVGASRESVNRELRALAARGLIRVGRGRIMILRPEALGLPDW